MSSVRVFVYGTLFPAYYNHRLVEALVEATAPGTVAGFRLFDLGQHAFKKTHTAHYQNDSKRQRGNNRNGLQCLNGVCATNP